MSTKSRRANSISPTTVILVLLLIGAIAGASHLVTPPPPLPPAEAPKTAPIDMAQKKHMIEEEQKKEEQTMKQHMNSAAAKVPKVADPSAMDITPDYFLHHKPGEAGLKQMDVEMAKKKAAYAAYQKQVAAETAASKLEPKAVAPTPH